MYCRHEPSLLVFEHIRVTIIKSSMSVLCGSVPQFVGQPEIREPSISLFSFWVFCCKNLSVFSEIIVSVHVRGRTHAGCDAMKRRGSFVTWSYDLIWNIKYCFSFWLNGAYRCCFKTLKFSVQVQYPCSGNNCIDEERKMLALPSYHVLINTQTSHAHVYTSVPTPHLCIV